MPPLNIPSRSLVSNPSFCTRLLFPGLGCFDDGNEENAVDVSCNAFTALEAQVGTCLLSYIGDT
jgi:hypothetical protein